ncbi:hypothetical protein [Streptomyces sp. NPDC003006]
MTHLKIRSDFPYETMREDIRVPLADGTTLYARVPLKAIVTPCSADDRYGNDVHYMGGSVLAVDMHAWAVNSTAIGHTFPPGHRIRSLELPVGACTPTVWSSPRTPWRRTRSTRTTH